MWLFLALLAVPLIEIGLFVVIGGAIGLWPTLAWVILSAGLGIVVLKGVASLGPISLSSDMNEMKDPLSPLGNRLLVVVGGGLLVLPGFLTDAVGLVLLIPPLRRQVIRLIAWQIGGKRDTVSKDAVIDGDWREVPPAEGEAAPMPPPDGTRH